MAWVESCGITGLDINVGDAVRLVGVYSSGLPDDGPGASWRPYSCAMRGTYDGDADARHIPAENSDQELQRAFFYSTLGVRDPRGSIVGSGDLPGDVRVWLAKEDAFQFLQQLPSAEAKQGTVGKVADDHVKALREMLRPLARTQHQEPDVRQAKALAKDYIGQLDYTPGLRLLDSLTLAMESPAQLDVWLQTWRDSYVLYMGMYEAKRAFTPSYRVGPREGNVAAVAELARYTRRKALHATMNASGD